VVERILMYLENEFVNAGYRLSGSKKGLVLFGEINNNSCTSPFSSRAFE
jgi:hypothetical protein